MLRKCYSTTARAYLGGPLVRIKWYFAPDGASWYPGGHVWEPVMYNLDKYPVPDTAGEVPWGQRNHWKGSRPLGVHSTGTACGTEADFLGLGLQPVKPNGRPDLNGLCGCAFQPEVRFKVKAKMQKINLWLGCTCAVGNAT